MGKQHKEEDMRQQDQPDKKRLKTDDNKGSNGKKEEPIDITDEVDDDMLVEQAWHHFTSFIESTMNHGAVGFDDDMEVCSGGGDDIDELYEILNLFVDADYQMESTTPEQAVAANGGCDNGDDQRLQVEPIAPGQDLKKVLHDVVTSKMTMLPVLMSVVYYIFADKAIDHFLLCKQQQKDGSNQKPKAGGTKSQEEEKDCCKANKCCPPKQQADNDNSNDIDEQGEDEKEMKRMIQHFITKSLHYYPYSAATWSMAANFGRMAHALNSQQICTWYEYAAELASVTRTHLETMEKAATAQQEDQVPKSNGKGEEEEDDDDKPSDLKQWIEVLLLNQTAGVEWSGDDDDDDDEDDDEMKKEEAKDQDKSSAPKAAYGKYSWSASLVESTSRFMAAMQLSIAGKHDEALQKHLRKFSVTHRLHPNLWNNSSNTTNNRSANGTTKNANNGATEKSKEDGSSLPVLRFCQKNTAGSGKDDNGGVLPQSLYQRLCSVFAPNAAYWRESDYSSRGYYSYFMDRRQSKEGAKDSDPQDKDNLIRDVIENHLLPLVEQALGEHHATLTLTTPTQEIVGYEWWVHTRPIQANLGHNLHFDTDEALLFQEKSVTHPIYSSVLYLTGGGSGGGGPTIVLDQTPDAQTVAQRGWRNEPKDNSFFIFPGNLLHGVLPCPGETSTTKSDDGDSSNDSNNNGTAIPALNDLWKNINKEEKQEEHNRLTFMVGFWTRRVPDGMKEQKLYGPCGKLPPANEKEHSWVLEISKGYDDKKNAANKKCCSKTACADNIQVVTVSPVTPVWEEIECYRDNDNNKDEEEKYGEPSLDIPGAIDHRFFVEGAPECFRDSLFERDEFDEDDNDSEGEEDEEE